MQTLQRDWLFQAMGEPLLLRTAKEIQWTRELAERLAEGRVNVGGGKLAPLILEIACGAGVTRNPAAKAQVEAVDDGLAFLPRPATQNGVESGRNIPDRVLHA